MPDLVMYAFFNHVAKCHVFVSWLPATVLDEYPAIQASHVAKIGPIPAIDRCLGENSQLIAKFWLCCRHIKVKRPV